MHAHTHAHTHARKQTRTQTSADAQERPHAPFSRNTRTTLMKSDYSATKMSYLFGLSAALFVAMIPVRITAIESATGNQRLTN